MANGNGHSPLSNGHVTSSMVNAHPHSDSYAYKDKVGYKINNYFWYYLFSFGANLGNEIFYICFLPFLGWNYDSFIQRRVCAFWALFMYLGQATKDILKFPRPPSPPVMRLEERYALEYGFPSTHAMVGAGLPFSLYFYSVERYEVRRTKDGVIYFYHFNSCCFVATYS